MSGHTARPIFSPMHVARWWFEVGGVFYLGATGKINGSCLSTYDGMESVLLVILENGMSLLILIIVRVLRALGRHLSME